MSITFLVIEFDRILQADAEKEPADAPAASKEEEEDDESDEEIEEITGGLLPQDLSKLKVDELTPLTPEVISRQASHPAADFFLNNLRGFRSRF